MPKKWHPSKPAPEKIRAAVALTQQRVVEPEFACFCGRPSSDLRLYHEHDERDLPIPGTDALVYMGNDIEHHECREILKKHPRLYLEEAGRPGSFPAICGPCKLRDGFACKHADLKANGGAGLLIQLRPLVPMNAIICPPPKGPKVRAESCKGFEPR